MVMHKIYSAAQRVVIWLGDASSDSDLAVSCFPDLVDHLKGIGTENIDYDAELRAGAEDTGGYSHWIFDLRGAEVLAIRNLLARSWFQRVWTLQEAALASPASILLCGSRQFPYHVLAEFTDRRKSSQGNLWETISSIIAPVRTDKEYQNSVSADTHSSFVRNLRAWQNGTSKGFTTAEFLDGIRLLGCTQISDRVLSLARFLPPEVTEHIAAVGTNDPSRLFTELATREIERDRGASIISAAEICQQAPPDAQNALVCPSWVPDWSCPDWGTRLSTAGRTVLRRHGRTLYQATGQSRLDMKVLGTDGDYTLQAKGKFLGTISQCLRPFVPPPDTNGLEGAALESARNEKMSTLEAYLVESLQLAARNGSGSYSEDTVTPCLDALIAGYPLQSLQGLLERQQLRPTDQELRQGLEEVLFVHMHIREADAIMQEPQHGPVHTVTGTARSYAQVQRRRQALGRSA